MTQFEEQDPVDQVFAIKTWRYLRVSMIMFVLGIFTAVGFEWAKTDPHCLQTSISAYYYTPVHGFFVGALVAVGTCLICLKGNTDREDILLDLAGMFAPVVALVPTPNTGSCRSVLTAAQNRDANISNNMFAVLVLGFVAFVFLGVLIVRHEGPLPRPAVIGYFVTVAVWLYAVYTFGWQRSFFTHTAHYTAAILMFVCFLLVVVLDAIHFRDETKQQVAPKTPARKAIESALQSTKVPPNRYGYIAIAMGADIVVFVILGILGWDYWVIGIEASLIALFAVFWGFQTAELWSKGLRGSGPSSGRTAPSMAVPPGGSVAPPVAGAAGRPDTPG